MLTQPLRSGPRETKAHAPSDPNTETVSPLLRELITELPVEGSARTLSVSAVTKCVAGVAGTARGTVCAFGGAGEGSGSVWFGVTLGTGPGIEVAGAPLLPAC